eukprot:31497-Pelagococcus_subviridis.AAC.6
MASACQRSARSVRGSFGGRDEPEPGQREPLRAHGREPRGVDHVQRLTVEVAPVRHRDLHAVQADLLRRESRVVLAQDVLDEHERRARFQNTLDLAHRRDLIEHAAQRERAHDRVRAVILQRQRLRDAVDDSQRRVLAAAAAERFVRLREVRPRERLHRVVRVHADDV